MIDHIITDRSLIDWSPPRFDPNYPGGQTGYVDPKGEDNSDELRMMGGVDFPSSLWIEPKDWKEYARAQQIDKLDAESVRQRFTNQGAGPGIRGTHECTGHSLIQGGETAIMQQAAGDPSRRMAFSQIGIYAIANPGQWGGANCLQMLRIAMEHGFIPEPIWGQSERFEHTLHGTCGKGNANNSRGNWVTPRSHPQYFSGAAATRQLFKPTEVINPRSREEMACIILRGQRTINVGRDGHAVPYMRLIWEPGQRSEQPTFQYSDSYDVIRYDSWGRAQKSVNGSSSIWSMSC
jgi:hypothetical protein